MQYVIEERKWKKHYSENISSTAHKLFHVSIHATSLPHSPHYFNLYLKNTSFSKTSSETLHLRGTKICPAQLKSRSTAAPLGRAELYFVNTDVKWGYCNNDDVVDSRLFTYVSTYVQIKASQFINAKSISQSHKCFAAILFWIFRL